LQGEGFADQDREPDHAGEESVGDPVHLFCQRHPTEAVERDGAGQKKENGGPLQNESLSQRLPSKDQRGGQTNRDGPLQRFPAVGRKKKK